jgi:hypothetical protein
MQEQLVHTYPRISEFFPILTSSDQKSIYQSGGHCSELTNFKFDGNNKTDNLNQYINEVLSSAIHLLLVHMYFLAFE